jgi:hypothetical protein
MTGELLHIKFTIIKSNSLKGGAYMKKWGKVIGVFFLILGIYSLNAQECSIWFSLSESDTTPVTDLLIEEGDTFTLHAWFSVDQPDWDWIDGVALPIWFNTDYLGFIGAALDTAVFENYMFYGVNCPTGCGFGSDYPDQVMWFAAVCLSGCLSPDGTPYHMGWFSFYATQSVPPSTVLIDTMLYPPSNPPMMNDNSGSLICYPSWTPITGNAQGVSEGSTPSKYFFSEPKPNPFKDKIVFNFGIPKRSHVSIDVYDISGRQVKKLLSEMMESGTYTMVWNGEDNSGKRLSSGVYFLRIVAEEYRVTKRLLILR